MSMITNLLSAVLGAEEEAEKMKTVPNRGDYRRAGQRRGRATHQVRRIKSRPVLEPHPIGQLTTATPAEQAKDAAMVARLDAAYDTNQARPEEERVPWVFPWQEQEWRDRRAARRRARAARRRQRS